MGRSVKKGPFIDSKLLKKVLKQRDTGDKQPIRTWSRSCIIIPEFVSHTFMVHNGKIFQECRATVGRVGNSDHMGNKLGKAGRKRWKGRRPHVRGTAMNPVAHPLGGGEGRSHGGRHPCSPTGVLAKGGKTRKRKSTSNKFIIRRRKSRRNK